MFLAATKDKDIFIVIYILYILYTVMYSILKAWVQGPNKASFLPAADMLFLACCRSRRSLSSVPAEVDLPRTVSSLFDQRLVELASGTGVDVRPAELAVILQAGDIGAKERGELSATTCPLTFVTQLVVQHVRLHLHLCHMNKQTQLFTFNSGNVQQLI